MSELVLDPYRPPASAPSDDAGEEAGELAGRGARLVASFIDNALLSVPFAFLLERLAVVIWSDRWLLLLAAAVVAVVLVQCRLLADRGQTVGKLVVGIRIVRRAGGHASFPRLLVLREGFSRVGFHLPFIGPIFWLVDALMIFREDRRCLHDLVADTIVVSVRRRRREKPADRPPYMPPELPDLEGAPR
jgi:uncharacterized RDD family membrane protein YckC